MTQIRIRHLLVLGAFLAGAVSAQTAPVPADAGDASGLSANQFYRLLLGDVALQRGDPVTATRAYMEAAREAKDPRLARRATEIALSARQRALAQDAAKLWSRLDPAAERPRQVLAALGSGANAQSDGDAEGGLGDQELRLRLERLLADTAAEGTGLGEAFLQLNRLFAQHPDKLAVYKLIRDLAKPYAKTPEANFAVALAGLNTGLADKAIVAESTASVNLALEARPDWERAALLKAEILSKQSPDGAVKYLQGFVAAQPKSRAANGALAQFLVEQKRYAEGRAIMQKLWDAEPESRELEFGVAAIALQMKDYAEAERLFQDLKRAGYGEAGVVDVYLAQVAEDSGRYADAIERYKVVPDTERGWLAKLRVGALYGKMGKLDDAKRWFADLPAVTIEQRVQVRQAEAQLLRDADDPKGAYAVLKTAVAEFPDSSDLVYDQAMVAEKLDRLDEAEALLKKVLEMRPNDAQALNALGYTLVDRTPRATEGFALIERAHKLSPADPFILDSMGWALFRLGRLDEAIDYLKRALATRPDAEIAAHLGEVLWAKGDREQARAVWDRQLEANPGNAVLQETMRRLGR